MLFSPIDILKRVVKEFFASYLNVCETPNVKDFYCYRILWLTDEQKNKGDGSAKILHTGE